ncbi:hypothetical protein HanPSC8_Chr04g0182041 [Helianthus annuus]|nr:hypothetical protein HanIR_Chr04g0203001 [Helianthus annuus]KAJ0933185.1 hypothetical protein HanPSC8_Chr04g0182041 [Helianthus annuus]
MFPLTLIGTSEYIIYNVDMGDLHTARMVYRLILGFCNCNGGVFFLNISVTATYSIFLVCNFCK